MASQANENAREAQIWRSKPAQRRLPAIAVHVLRNKAVSLLRFIGFAGATTSRLQEFHTDHSGLGRWRRKVRPGSHAKPDHLQEIDWECVARHEHEIPFLGLKEYWYPGLKSSNLPANKPVPLRLCSESIVFFRNAQGLACAIEDRCPHRGPQLSLGQVGAFAPGTITCRYHGMTFDGEGECVAVLGDGPDSPACGRIKTRRYPTEERGGIVWVYTGQRQPPPIEDTIPHFKEVMDDRDVFIHQLDLPVSYLAALDNAVDLAHPSCLHRSCLPFASQSISVSVGWEEMADGGIKAFTAGQDETVHSRKTAHDGVLNVSESNWYPPNIAFFDKTSLGFGELFGENGEHGYVFAAPKDIASTNYWLIFSQPKFTNPIKRAVTRFMHNMMHGVFFKWPGSNLSCIDQADAVMMISQGLIPNWDRDKLLRVDGAIVQVRRKLRRLHRDEVEEFPARGRIVPSHFRPLLEGASRTRDYQ